jgi:hypothetical protein
MVAAVWRYDNRGGGGGGCGGYGGDTKRLFFMKIGTFHENACALRVLN